MFWTVPSVKENIFSVVTVAVTAWRYFFIWHKTWCKKLIMYESQMFKTELKKNWEQVFTFIETFTFSLKVQDIFYNWFCYAPERVMSQGINVILTRMEGEVLLLFWELESYRFSWIWVIFLCILNF
jgi:hypothetical protein